MTSPRVRLVAGPPESVALRAALGQFATGVTVVGTGGPDGQLHACTANSFTSVSLDPPLVLVCLARDSRCLEALQYSGVFSVNVLAEDQADLSRHFADRHRPTGSAGFAGVALSRDRHGCPRFAGTLAAFACRVDATYDGGDHVVVLGRVTEFVCRPGSEPLVFHGGAYRPIAPTETRPLLAS